MNLPDKQLIGLAVLQCATVKQDIDIYLAGDGKVKSIYAKDNNSGTYINRLSYEKGVIVIRDNKGKEIERRGEAEEVKVAAKKSKEVPGN
jgi:hypothetical protein